MKSHIDCVTCDFCGRQVVIGVLSEGERLPHWRAMEVEDRILDACPTCVPPLLAMMALISIGSFEAKPPRWK